MGTLGTRPLRSADARLLRCAADVEQSSRSWDLLPSREGAVGGAAWIRSWLAAYGDRHELAVALAGDSEAPRAVLPLARSRLRPWSWELLGVGQLGEPTDALAATTSDLRPAVDLLARLRAPLTLRRLPAASALLPVIDEVYDRRALVFRRAAPGTPTLALDDSWREPEAHFSTRRRSDVRAARRRAARVGHVQFAVEEPTPATVDALFDELVAVEAAGWKTRAGTALAARPQMQMFFRTYCRLTAAEGALRLAFLRIDGRPVAAQLAVERADRYLLFKIGYDEDFARCSPGNLLMLHTVRWAAERGLESYEFLGSREPWTDLWTEQIRPCLDVRVYPASAWSPVAAAAVGGRALCRVPSRRSRAAAERTPQ